MSGWNLPTSRSRLHAIFQYQQLQQQHQQQQVQGRVITRKTISTLAHVDVVAAIHCSSFAWDCPPCRNSQNPPRAEIPGIFPLENPEPNSTPCSNTSL